tara:strand:+ start:4699 stop:5649 length:951 start_codon:yes stop_codon:yes gene_type:complete
MASITATPLGLGMGVRTRSPTATALCARACSASKATTSFVASNRRTAGMKHASVNSVPRVTRRQHRVTKCNATPSDSMDDEPFDPFSLFSSNDSDTNNALATDENKLLENRLGRAAMLGFFFTTLGDVVTSGEGPLEQLKDEELYLINHINPLNVAQDVLGAVGIYVETVFIVWLTLAICFLLAVQNGLANPTKTYSSKSISSKKAQKTESLTIRANKTVESFKRALKDQVDEQAPYELFNGRLAMVGFALAVMGDRITGGLGPLEQLNSETGIPVIDAELFGAFFLFGVFFNVVATGVKVSAKAWRNGKDGVVSR